MSECAWCASRTKQTHFSSRYKRVATRRGKKRSIVALARVMLEVVYTMLKDKTKYVELGDNYMDEQRKTSQIKYHREQLNRLLGKDSPDNQSA